MDSEYYGACINKDEGKNLASAAGVASQAAFTLKRVRNIDSAGTRHTSESSNAEQTTGDMDCSSSDDVKFVRALRRRPWVIDYGKFDNSSEDESDNNYSFKLHSSKASLPRGVIRGCSKCDDCQKVVARWRPEDGCRPMLDEAPVFYPNEKEFDDPLKYIASIRPIAEPYGICRIVPPPSWQPPCPIRQKTRWETIKFPTRVQQIDKLQVREPMNKKPKRANNRRKRRRHSRKGRPRSHHYAMEFDSECSASDEEGRFGFDSGSEFTLERFEKYANNFKKQYFDICGMESNTEHATLHNSNSKWGPSVESIEAEYWRIVEKPTEEIEVLYGADVESGVFGSGFSKRLPETDPNDADPYAFSGWNLNNFPRLPGSVLSFEGTDISGVLVPWLYLGMCFSSFCWHVEDHHFYSLNYMHFGAPKVWYGVPGNAAVQLEKAMRKHLPDLFEEQPDLLHKLVTQLSPSILKSEGVPVYRSVQNPGEFVLTFPRAYHAGFNCGFNCAEAVNVAPLDWLPYGQNAVELYREQCRKTSVSHDKLLLVASKETVKAMWETSMLKNWNCTNSGWHNFPGEESIAILSKSLRTRIEMEQARRDFLAKHLKMRKMDPDFDTSERECFICFYDLYLSAVGCECCPQRFSCLDHARQLCSCPWARKFLLSRYDIMELEVLTEALERKKDAIYKWASFEFGAAVNTGNAKGGSAPTEASLNLTPHQKKSVIKTLLEESKTSFTSMLNSACGVNGDGIMSAIFQASDSKVVNFDAKLKKNNENMLRAVGTEVGHVSSFSAAALDPSLETSSDIKSMMHPLANHYQDRRIIYPEQLTKISSVERKATVSENSSEKISLLDINKPFHPNVNGPQMDFENTLENGKMDDNSLTEQSTSICLSQPKNMADCLQRVEQDFVKSNFRNCPQTKSYQGKLTDEANIICKNYALRSSDFSFIGENVFIAETEDGCLQRDRDQSGRCMRHSRDTPSCALTMAQIGQHAAPEDLKPKMSSPNQMQTNLSGLRKTSGSSAGISQDILCLSLLRNNSTQEADGVVPSESVRSKEVEEVAVSGDFPLYKMTTNVACNTVAKGMIKDTSALLNHRTVVNCAQNFLQIFTSNSTTGNPDEFHPNKGSCVERNIQQVGIHVELLDVGILRPLKSWYNSQIIFTKGFRSRVKYFSVLDPSRMCYYISEILDAGLVGPIFKVFVEDQPTYYFVHSSIDKCWNLVRKKVNEEIMKSSTLQKHNNLGWQTPERVNGLEMFGLTTPSVIKAIENLDHDHRCIEYWASKGSNVGCDTQSGGWQEKNKIFNFETKKASDLKWLNSLDSNICQPLTTVTSHQEESNYQDPNSYGKIYRVLKGLFRRASPEELCTMHKVLNGDTRSAEREAAFKALMDAHQNL
eukprot:TRINITY_DN4105_c0_g1_i1.p1 TRINITY_DN4105_c0_g1~~TRINITY_DN4105_c0_g1_i1.p1  ORF type:complete len:1382 (-),score=296.77 TRINITY_DN4105_c0_g1_i1:53-4198(-)